MHDIDSEPPPIPNGEDGLAYLAARISSITPNTAATERSFSKFKSHHTISRNRLHHETVRKMTMVKDHILDMHGTARKRKHDELDPVIISSMPSAGPSTMTSEPEATANLLIEPLEYDDEENDLTHAFEEAVSGLEDEALAAPGESDETLDLMGHIDPSADEITTATQPLTIRISVPSHLASRSEHMLHFLFISPPFSSSTTSTTSVLDSFWKTAQEDLAAETRLHEQVFQTLQGSPIA